MKDKATIIVHSGDMDKIYSALIIGNGALAMGMEASLFFTFWGLQRLVKGGLEKGPLSRMHLLGLGKWMIKKRMKRANVASLKQLLEDYKTLGGKIYACEMTMKVMGIKRADLLEDVIDDFSSIIIYIKEARESTINLFI